MPRDKNMDAAPDSSPISDQPRKRIEQARSARRARHGKKARRTRARGTQLTGRQEEVLRLVATGLTNKECAAQLGLSVHTIESHLHSIYGKIGVLTRGAAIRFAMDHGLIAPKSRESGEKNT